MLRNFLNNFQANSNKNLNNINSNNDKFAEFLLAEYENIATAHFETGKQISEFIKFYLLILAAPVIILTLVKDNKLYKNLFNPISNDEILIHWISFIVLLGISVFGFLMSIVVINLKHDSIIYARTVNGIRSYFYDKYLNDPIKEENIIVLPKRINKPNYYAIKSLFPIFIAFSFVNTMFFFAAMVVGQKEIDPSVVILSCLFLIVHFGFYFSMSYSQEHKKVHLKPSPTGIYK